MTKRVEQATAAATVALLGFPNAIIRGALAAFAAIARLGWMWVARKPARQPRRCLAAAK